MYYIFQKYTMSLWFYKTNSSYILDMVIKLILSYDLDVWIVAYWLYARYSEIISKLVFR